MIKLRRSIALVLALALTCALFTSVLAADPPKLTYTQSGNSARLTLNNLGNESVYGVQLTLTFSGNYSGAVFTPAASTSYAPPCQRTTVGDSTQVVLYLTAQAALNQGSSFELGTLALPSSFTMPEAATVTLLDRDLKPLADTLAITVSKQTGGGSSSGGSSSGGGSRPSPSPSPTPTPTPAPTPVPDVPFTDVRESDWFYQEVKYVYEKGMMNGVSGDAFAPNSSTSRAMLVTILYRLAGSPAAQAPTFPDVSPTQYYTYPVGWAAGQSIVNGYEDGRFLPDGLITREQLAAVLYRYSRAMGYNTALRGDLSKFSDQGKISAYAAEPMSWAVAAGLLSGMGDGTVNPQGYATRAQVAAILTRFCKAFVAPQGQ